MNTHLKLSNEKSSLNRNEHLHDQHRKPEFLKSGLLTKQINPPGTHKSNLIDTTSLIHGMIISQPRNLYPTSIIFSSSAKG